MSTINTGGPAFPVPDTVIDGMTLRDYFAAKAMQGMLASGNLSNLLSDQEFAIATYELADAMLKARQ